jgi:hypothetical protein
MEAERKSLSKKKSPGPAKFSAEVYKTLKEELLSTLLKYFHKIEREGALPNLFYESSVTLIQILDKDTTTKRITGQFCNEHGCKNPQ